MTDAKKKYLIVLFSILVLSLVLKLYHVESYSTYTDEILSAIAAKSIFNNGIPLLPSGYLYSRSFLYHYILSLPVGLFGIDYLPMRINSILFSLFTMGLLYMLGARSAGPKVGLAAVFLLTFNSVFNQMSLSARMYMAYAFFYVGAFYFFYEGYLQQKVFLKKFALLGMAAAMLCSEAAVVIGPVFFVLLMLFKKAAWLKDRTVWLSGLVWAGLIWATMVFKIPNSYTPFSVDSGLSQALIIDLGQQITKLIVDLTYSVRNLDAVLPFSMPFFCVMTFWVIKKKAFKEHFALMALLPALLVQSFYTFKVQDRVIITLVPFYILACCHFVATLWQWWIKAVKEEKTFFNALRKHSFKVGISLVVLICLSVGFVYEKQMRKKSGIARYNFHPFYDSFSDADPRQGYIFLNANVQPGDIVIQTTAEYGLFFLKKDLEYFYLRQKALRGEDNELKYTVFDKSREPYYGHPIIDSIAKLEKLVSERKSSVWVVMGPKAIWAVGPDLKTYIQQNFSLEFQAKKTKVYCRRLHGA